MGGGDGKTPLGNDAFTDQSCASIILIVAVDKKGYLCLGFFVFFYW